jgi:hypothetical protein
MIRDTLRRSLGVIAAALLLCAPAAGARAAQLEITFTNNRPAGGFAFTPLWVALHNGSFDLFDPGSAASAGLEQLAELGATSGLDAALAGQGVSGVVGSAGIPPFVPGESASAPLMVADPTDQRFLTFASMVVPSNDLFIGNGNPTGIELFDASGAFLGPRTIQIFGRMVWDAGTEVNSILDGGAFVVGVGATGGAAENGVVHLFFDDPGAPAYLSSIVGIESPNGPITNAFDGNSLLATITIRAVPEPSSLALAALGLGALSALRRVSRRR